MDPGCRLGDPPLVQEQVLTQIGKLDGHENALGDVPGTPHRTHPAVAERVDKNVAATDQVPRCSPATHLGILTGNVAGRVPTALGPTGRRGRT